MVNEVVMYMSVTLIGMVAFGFFSATMNSYTLQAEELTAESNLDDILHKLGEKIDSILETAHDLRGSQQAGANIELTMKVDIPGDFSGRTYQIFLSLDVEGKVVIESKFADQNTVLSSYSTGILNSSVAMTGSINSAGASYPHITYLYDFDTATESITLYNN